MVYECIKGFCINVVDGDGFIEEHDGFVVEEGTKWKSDSDAVNVTGAGIHLEEVEGTQWLQISKENLDTDFRVVECEEQCRTSVTNCSYWDTDKCKLHC